MWRQPGEEYKDKCVLPTVKHGGGSVMVWGCMSAAGTGELQFIEGTMNDNMYCDILKQSMIPSLQRLGKVEERKVSNIHQLRDDVMEKWKRTPVVSCEALVNSIPKRVNTVLENNGGHTKY